MGNADSPARSNFAPWSRRRKESPILGRDEKEIRSQDGSASHTKLRSPQYRRRRRGPFAQARGRVVGGSQKIVRRFCKNAAASDTDALQRPTVAAVMDR